MAGPDIARDGRFENHRAGRRRARRSSLGEPIHTKTTETRPLRDTRCFNAIRDAASDRPSIERGGRGSCATPQVLLVHRRDDPAVRALKPNQVSTISRRNGERDMPPWRMYGERPSSRRRRVRSLVEALEEAPEEGLFGASGSGLGAVGLQQHAATRRQVSD